jgi:hypothetical protein
MYEDSANVIITGGDATNPLTPTTGVKFAGGQALIDSTGESQDELRRVQVRIPLTTSINTFPVYGLQSTGTLCKQLADGPTVATADSCPNHP